MKVITIKQPYASLICDNKKMVEIRSWKTKYRGELYIHAGLGINKVDMIKYQNIIPIENHLKGKIIGVCDLIDCVYLDKEYINNYNEKYKDTGYTISLEHIGYYGFVLNNIKKLNELIEVKGKLSIWNYEVTK